MAEQQMIPTTPAAFVIDDPVKREGMFPGWSITIRPAGNDTLPVAQVFTGGPRGDQRDLTSVMATARLLGAAAELRELVALAAHSSAQGRVLSESWVHGADALLQRIMGR